jgi:hypothetical protein
MAAAGMAADGGHRRSSAASSPVRWLLHIMLLRITMRRPMHRHRPMGRGGGVTQRSLITLTHKLAPAGSEPFSRGETETKTRVDDISRVSCAFPGACSKILLDQSPTAERVLEALPPSPEEPD